MSTLRSLLLLSVASLLLAGGCVIDKTSRSATYLLYERIDNTRSRVHTMEKDLALQSTRVEDMEERAANGRRRLADSGATLETFLEELQGLRGEVADMRHDLRQGVEDAGAVSFRLSALEARLTHMEKELDITPPLFLPPVRVEEPPPDRRGGAKGSVRVEEPDEESAPRHDKATVFDGRGDDGDGAVASVVTEEEAGAEEPSNTLGASEDIVVENEQPSEEDALFQSALVLVKKKDWEKAGARLQRFVRDHPTAARALEARFLLAQCMYELGRYKGAITTWQKVIEADEHGAWAPKSMFMQGMSFEELGTAEDLEASRVFFAELIRLYPDAPDAERAKVKLEALSDP